ncbi:unnamed protein product [Schistocephalus solidus]|uniref:RT_RNaseH domain-containing protein n=1 Tax=Schistocephalus solidus TaxID=70667 RepID=A0A183SKH0_SCHSO|nr:unnamed protein product [Schistocephalus solidus]
MVSFPHLSLPSCADLMLPLTNMLSSPKALTAFEEIKAFLVNASYPRRSLSLMVDVSTLTVNTVLHQHSVSSTLPLAFSEKLLPTWTLCSTFGSELFAIYLAVKNSRYPAEDRDFTISTTRKPLKFTLRFHSDKDNQSESASRRLHGLFHPRIRASQKLLAETFLWLCMNNGVKVWRHLRFSPNTSPSAWCSHVHLDVIDPLPPFNGYIQLLSCIALYTRWTEPIPLPNVEVNMSVKVFHSLWVVLFCA